MQFVLVKWLPYTQFSPLNVVGSSFWRIYHFNSYCNSFSFFSCFSCSVLALFLILRHRAKTFRKDSTVYVVIWDRTNSWVVILQFAWYKFFHQRCSLEDMIVQTLTLKKRVVKWSSIKLQGWSTLFTMLGFNGICITLGDCWLLSIFAFFTFLGLWEDLRYCYCHDPNGREWHPH